VLFAVKKTTLAAITVCAPNLVNVAVKLVLSVEGVQYVVQMVVVRLQDPIHVVEPKTVWMGIHVVIIIVVDLVKDVVLVVHAELARDVVYQARPAAITVSVPNLVNVAVKLVLSV
jgi:hypothetical protein